MTDTFLWRTPGLTLEFAWSQTMPVSLVAIWAEDLGRGHLLASHLVELNVLGQGRSHNIRRALVGTLVGERMRYVSHQEGSSGEVKTLSITQEDQVTGLRAETVFEVHADTAACAIRTQITNAGTKRWVLQSAPAVATGAVISADSDPADLWLYRGQSAWSSENRWQKVPLFSSETLVPAGDHVMEMPATSEVTASGRSTWTTEGALPVGAVEDARTGRTFAWEVEAAGAPWVWQCALSSNAPLAAVLVLSGPCNELHNWCSVLEVGDSYVTPSVTVAIASDGLDGALRELTRHRRWRRSKRVVEGSPSLIFNDYMNTIAGDPTTEKLLPLIDAAHDLGVETFCIDCGWYDDTGDWWPSVGQWQPSQTRFEPGGLQGVLDYIAKKGMKPGLWVEPESVGVSSPMVSQLPSEAFISRNGVPVVERDRYLLDMRSAAARDHLDQTFDRLIGWGARMFKIDYNVTPGIGPDTNTPSTGAGLEEHRDHFLQWFDALRSRHPEVVFENCSSGGMRQDFGHVSHFDLQSTSDQQSHLLYPVIATGAPMSLPLELCGNWSYPHALMSEEEYVLALVNGLAGRFYLSGYLNQMTPERLSLVRDACDFYLEHRETLVTATPSWPLGLPQWEDPVVCLGWRTYDLLRLFIWQRGENAASVTVPLPEPQDGPAKIVFPKKPVSAWEIGEGGEQELVITLAPGPCARIIDVPLQTAMRA